MLILPASLICKGCRLAMQHGSQQLLGILAPLIEGRFLQMRMESSARLRWMTQPWNVRPPSIGPGSQVCTTLQCFKHGASL